MYCTWVWVHSSTFFNHNHGFASTKTRPLLTWGAHGTPGGLSTTNRSPHRWIRWAQASGLSWAQVSYRFGSECTRNSPPCFTMVSWITSNERYQKQVPKQLKLGRKSTSLYFQLSSFSCFHSLLHRLVLQGWHYFVCLVQRSKIQKQYIWAAPW